MLKEYVEKGSVSSDVNIHGVQEVPAIKYVGTRHSCTFDTVSDSMATAFTELAKKFEAMGRTPNGAFSIYHKWDMKSGDCEYTAAIPVEQSFQLPEGLIGGTIPATKAVKVTHTGSYDHLGNAWSGAYMYQRSKKHKMNKAIDGYEIYVNDPQSTPEAELITEVYVPVK